MTTKARISVLSAIVVAIGGLSVTAAAEPATLAPTPRMCDVECPPQPGWVFCGGSCTGSTFTCSYASDHCVPE